MSADFSIKPIGASVATTYAGIPSEAARSAALTILPPDKAVSSAAAPSAGNSYAQSPGEDVRRQADYDRAAAEIVYRVIDSRTNQIVRQLPDEARLRARIYGRAQDAARAERKARRTDRTI